jgi:hypothetical protein
MRRMRSVNKQRTINVIQSTELNGGKEEKILFGKTLRKNKKTKISIMMILTIIKLNRALKNDNEQKKKKKRTLKNQPSFFFLCLFFKFCRTRN